MASGQAPGGDADVPGVAGGAERGKRRRLAKAFDRPLDKALRDSGRVRVKVSVRADEYAQLLALQQQFAELGVRVKKSALLCAGLRLLAQYDDEDFLCALGRLPSID